MKTFKKNHGFTLVEALVAITILVIGVLGPLVLVARNISDGSFLRNRNTAIYLAREGMELVFAKKVINLEKEGNPDWLDGIIVDPLDLNKCYYGQDCFIDPLNFTSNPVVPCSVQTCQLRYDTSNNLDLYLPYVVGTGSGPVYTRSIKFEKKTVAPIDPPLNYVKVTVTVQWPEKGVTKEVKVERYMYPSS